MDPPAFILGCIKLDDTKLGHSPRVRVNRHVSRLSVFVSSLERLKKLVQGRRGKLDDLGADLPSRRREDCCCVFVAILASRRVRKKDVG
jgi:hypothetical protein